MKVFKSWAGRWQIPLAVLLNTAKRLWQRTSVPLSNTKAPPLGTAIKVCTYILPICLVLNKCEEPPTHEHPTSTKRYYIVSPYRALKWQRPLKLAILLGVPAVTRGPLGLLGGPKTLCVQFPWSTTNAVRDKRRANTLFCTTAGPVSALPHPKLGHLGPLWWATKGRNSLCLVPNPSTAHIQKVPCTRCDTWHGTRTFWAMAKPNWGFLQHS